MTVYEGKMFSLSILKLYILVYTKSTSKDGWLVGWLVYGV